jgi:nitrogenase delta subunit
MSRESVDVYVGDVLDYIMKKCLWQFHSRAWDRKKQNEGIMGMARQILLGQEPARDLPEERCYWVDAVVMARGLREYYPWASELAPEVLGRIMDETKIRLDHLTVHGSLNEELSDPKY